tara:strand:- start:209 stop:616 length:408 start_codon:yes stop_codon:yes gene_type:complete
MYSFKNRLNKLISFDTIRLLKILELIQYAIILYLLVITVSYFLDNYIINHKYEGENIGKLLLSSLFDLIIIIIVTFYLRKLALLFPSIPHLLYPKFKENTTIDYSFQIAVGVVFVEFLPSFINNIKKIVNLMLVN